MGFRAVNVASVSSVTTTWQLVAISKVSGERRAEGRAKPSASHERYISPTRGAK